MAIPHQAHAPTYEYLLPPVWLKQSTCIHCGKPIQRVAMFEFEHVREESHYFVEDAIQALDRVQKSRVWFEPYSDCLNAICEAKEALYVLSGYDAVREHGGDPMRVRNKKYAPSFDDMRSY